MIKQAHPFAPGNMLELTARITSFKGKINYVAGGTDLIISLANEPWPEMIIDISQLASLKTIEIDRKGYRIGAVATISTLANHPELQENLAALNQAARQIGSVQIRNRATIGGNIASAVPGGDLLPALKCLDCRIEVLQRNGTTKTLGFDDVVLGPGKTCLENGDLITSIFIPYLSTKNHISAFVKIGRRKMLTIARVNLAVVADFDQEKNYINDIRIVAGAIGPVPIRLHKVEQHLKGRLVDQSFANNFLNALSTAVDEAIPGRYSQSYKRQAIMGAGLDLMEKLFVRKFEVNGVYVDFSGTNTGFSKMETSP